MPRRPAYRLSVACLVIGTLAGCALAAPAGMAPAEPGAPGAPVPAAVAGVVTLDLAALQAAWGAPRSLKAAAADTGVVATLRLTVHGAGHAAVSATTPFAIWPTGTSTAGAPARQLTLKVPAGPNQLFVVEGLNGGGQVVRRITAAGHVVAGQPIALRVDYLADAVGRVLEDLLLEPAMSAGDRAVLDGLDAAERAKRVDQLLATGTCPDDAGIVARLADTDLVTPLAKHVDRLVGFDAAKRVYTGAVDPVAFRARMLANLLRLKGAAVLAAEPAGDLKAAAGAEVALEVRDAKGVLVPDADVALFDPRRTTGKWDGGKAYRFGQVPPGMWLLAAQKDGTTLSSTVRVVDQEAPAVVTLTLPAPKGDPEIFIYRDAAAELDWAITGSGGATVDLAGDQPHTGTSAIKAVTLPAGGGVVFLAKAGTYPLKTYRGFRLTAKAVSGAATYRAQFFDGIAPMGGALALPIGADYATVAGAMATAGLTATQKDRVRGFILSATGAAELRVDDVSWMPCPEGGCP